MTKKLLITLGILLLTGLLLFWGYLLLFGTPSSIREFTNFGSTPATEVRTRATGDPTAQLSIENQKFEQLTTRPVAGFVNYNNGSQNVLRYVERGTGHVYEINLDNGQENRISNVTLGKVTGAKFSPLGDLVVFYVETNDTVETKVEALDNSVSLDLPKNAKNISWSQDGDTVFYTTEAVNETVAHKITNGSESTLWNIPLTQVKVYFTDQQSFVATKPGANYFGGLYEVVGGQLKKYLSGGFATTALVNPEGSGVLYGYFNTEIQNFVSQYASVTLPVTLIPEKCAFFNENYAVCLDILNLNTNSDRSYINEWYKGKVATQDYIQLINLNTGSVELGGTLMEEIGFNIDVTDLQLGTYNNLLFINKIDGTLWLYKPEIITTSSSDLSDLDMATTSDDGGEQTPVE